MRTYELCEGVSNSKKSKHKNEYVKWCENGP